MGGRERELVVRIKPGENVKYLDYEGVKACAVAMDAELGPWCTSVEWEIRDRSDTDK